jgi:hypothetical protein
MLLCLAGRTALPAGHDPPREREPVPKHLADELEAQTRAATGRIVETPKAPGTSPKGIVLQAVAVVD